MYESDYGDLMKIRDHRAPSATNDKRPEHITGTANSISSAILKESPRVFSLGAVRAWARSVGISEGIAKEFLISEGVLIADR
jgi:hypothetical protein